MPRVLLFLYAESPVHAGADSSVGVVDLPIQREASTGLPVIWGQSLKGALREHAARVRSAALPVEEVFGTSPPSSGEREPTGGLKPGTLSVGDAQLVAFPTPTLMRTFAWLTSPLALGRLARKASLAGIATPASSDGGPDNAALPHADHDGPALAADAAWVSDTAVFGPYVLPCQQDRVAATWASWLAGAALPGVSPMPYFAGKLTTDLIAVGDGLLASLSTECTEVAARVQLGAKDEQGRPTKTVAHGPFYGEYLPAETVLAALLDCASQAHLAALTELLNNQILRIGGDETIGKGLVWCRFANDGQG